MGVVMLYNQAVLPGKRGGDTASSLMLMFMLWVMMPEAARATSVAVESRSEHDLVEFSIPAGPLDQMLSQLAWQAGTTLSFSPRQVEAFSGAPLMGAYTLQSALAQLLRGTPLVVEAAAGSGYVVRARAWPLTTMKVVGVPEVPLSIGTGLGVGQRETPQSVSQMTSERMAAQGLLDLNSIVRNMPGVSTKVRDTERNTFSARGYSIDDIQIDGIPIPGHFNSESMTSPAPYEWVELVRGATGLLTGAGDPSASINLVRKHADSDVFSGRLSVSTGSWNYYGGGIDLNGPLNSDASVRGRLIADYAQSDSFRDVYSTDTGVIYGVVDADLTERTHLSVGLSRHRRTPEGSTWGGLPVFFADGSRTRWGRSKTTAADWAHIDSFHNSYFANWRHQFADDWTLKLDLNRFEQTSDWQVIWWVPLPESQSTRGYSGSPSRHGAGNLLNVVELELLGHYRLLNRSHELVLGSRYSEISQYWWGAPAISASFDVPDFTDWNGSDIPEPQWGVSVVGQDLDIRERGYFASTRLNLTEQLKVILGGRLSDWSVQGFSWISRIDESAEPEFTSYAGVLYDLNAQHRLYASYAEIFRPQPDSFDRHGSMLESLEGRSYELGLKSRLLNERLQSTVALFRVVQDNVAQLDNGYFVPGTDLSASHAVKGTYSQGIDLEVSGELSPGWQIYFSYIGFSAHGDEDDINTDHPRQLLKLFSSWQLSGDWHRLTLGGGLNWEASNYTLTTNPATGAEEKLKQSSFYLLNLMARYDFTPQLSAQLNVENLLDEVYYDQIGFYDQYAWGAPRNVRLQLNYTF